MTLNGVVRKLVNQTLQKNVIECFRSKHIHHKALICQCYTTSSTSNQELSKESNADKDIDVLLRAAISEEKHSSSFTEIVPGKGPPPEPPVTCCMSGCANCVWIQYAEELKQYYKDGTERALKEIDLIENPSLKAFIKLELSLS